MKLREFMVLVSTALAVAVFPSPPALAASTTGPIYVHMNGLNDFLPRVVFARPGEPVVFVNEDTGIHSIHGYRLIGGQRLKDIDAIALAGMSSASARPHTYTVHFTKAGTYYYLCTVHAHLVKVYRAPGGADYFMPSRRQAISGYGGTMSGVIIVTRERSLLDSNPPITHQRVLQGLWSNGDVKDSGNGS